MVMSQESDGHVKDDCQKEILKETWASLQITSLCESVIAPTDSHAC